MNNYHASGNPSMIEIIEKNWSRGYTSNGAAEGKQPRTIENNWSIGYTSNGAANVKLKQRLYKSIFWKASLCRRPYTFETFGRQLFHLQCFGSNAISSGATHFTKMTTQGITNENQIWQPVPQKKKNNAINRSRRLGGRAWAAAPTVGAPACSLETPSEGSLPFNIARTCRRGRSRSSPLRKMRSPGARSIQIAATTILMPATPIPNTKV